MLGERLVELRKRKGLTQEEFSSLLNISRATYAQYEIDRRQPDYETLEKIADSHKVSTDYLLGRTDDPISHESQRLTDKFSYKGPRDPSFVERFFEHDNPPSANLNEDLVPTPKEEHLTFYRKVGQLSPESMAILDQQADHLLLLESKIVARKNAERRAERAKKSK